MRRENLTVDEAAEAMGAIMSGDATPAQVAALLVGLTMKGERPSEIVGLAKTMRANAVQLSRTFDDVFDTCGTGGDRSGTFNISSAAALVAAAAGMRMAKHGNRSVSSQCGSADVYEALGVNISAAPAVVERSLETVGVAFFFAPTFHPSMRQAGSRQARARRSDRIQPARAADEPCGRAAAARGRTAFGADGAARPGLIAPGIGPRLGRTRRGRHRRVVDDRAHKNLRVPEWRGLDVLRASVGFRDFESRTP